LTKRPTFLTTLASFSILIGGLMYIAYGWLPHQDYLPTSLALTALSGIVVYVILIRVVQI
jgi:hypothetical protein